MKKKKLTKKQLKGLRFEFTEKGFTLWDKRGIWILDGSCLMEDGIISFSNRNHKDIQVVIEDRDDFFGHKNITLVASSKE